MRPIRQDEERLILSTGSPARARSTSKRIKGRFLRGPIPMAWLDAARAVRGKAIHVALEIWHWSFIKGSKTVKLNLSRLARCGVARTTAGRALRDLEDAGLVSVRRAPGRAPIVTILDVEQGAARTEQSGDS